MLKNQKGQGLLEYLILTAFMAVACIGIVSLLSQSVSAQFANVIYSIQGSKKKAKKEYVSSDYYQKRNLSNFMNRSVGSQKND